MDIVVTHYSKPLAWLTAFAVSPNRVFVYQTSAHLPRPSVCAMGAVACLRIPNIGREMAGYLTHIVQNYNRLANVTAFLQDDPFTVSPDLNCLLERPHKFLPVQPLSWVQFRKRSNPLFANCKVNFVDHCRVYVDSVNTAFEPKLHDDMWVTRLIAYQQFHGDMYRVLHDAFSGQTNRSAPQEIFRSYGSQFAMHARVLREKPVEVYDNMLQWVTRRRDTPWSKCYTDHERGLVLEYAWLSLVDAHRFLSPVCEGCRAATDQCNRSRSGTLHDAFRSAPHTYTRAQTMMQQKCERRPPTPKAVRPAS